MAEEEDKKRKVYRSRFEPLSDKDMAVMQQPIDPRFAYSSALQAIKDGIPQAGTDRWLWVNGAVSEGMKINLVNFGYMSHPKVQNVEVIIPETVPDGQERFVAYKIFMPKREVKRYLARRKRIQWLTGRDGLFWRWLLVKLLERYDLVDIDRNIRRGVREYLGQSVPVVVDVLVGD